jgi:hypothetical protein
VTRTAVSMSEAQLQSAVVDAAHTYGFLVAHFRTAPTPSGRWSTPVGADGRGWPDLCLVGRGRVLFRELKSAAGRLSPDQETWRDRLSANGADWALWRPCDWLDGTITTELSR